MVQAGSRHRAIKGLELLVGPSQLGPPFSFVHTSIFKAQLLQGAATDFLGAFGAMHLSNLQLQFAPAVPRSGKSGQTCMAAEGKLGSL